MNIIIKYALRDLLRTRFVLAYSVLLFACTVALFQLDSDPAKVVLSMLNVLLMVVPLVSAVFTSIHFFNSYEFMELMLAQPINRRSVFLSEYAAVASSLCCAFLIGVGLPLLIYGSGIANWVLLFTGMMLTLTFTSLAFLSSVLTRDKAKAVGIALFLWLYFSLIYDGFVLWLVYSLSDYPLEKVTLALIALNPVDLARILMLLQLDISALMGYTGAFYKDFFGSYVGVVFSFTTLLIWVVAPMVVALRVFERKDW
jgi:Cu-processing system permease protein